MSKQKGFTLIELLVVIAIIALLMSVLMPALAKSRRTAKAVICQSNLRQWAIIFSSYTDDNMGSFPPGRDTRDWEDNWWSALEPYYKDRALLCCPVATDPDKNPWDGYGNTGTWGPQWFPTPDKGPNKGITFYGSYGINEWISDRPVSERDGRENRDAGNPAKYWRSTNVTGQSTIPLMADSWWDQAWAEADDWIPEYPGQFEGTPDDMAHFCHDRHDGGLNMLFIDYSLRRIKVIELWNFRWHRGYDFDDIPNPWDFPVWIQKLQ